MPKTSNEGPSYAGLVDVSGADTLVPEWAPADGDEAVAAPADVSRETKAADDKADDKAAPAPRKSRGKP